MVYSPEQEKVRTGSIEASTCPVYIDLRIRATVSIVDWIIDKLTVEHWSIPELKAVLASS